MAADRTFICLQIQIIVKALLRVGNVFSFKYPGSFCKLSIEVVLHPDYRGSMPAQALILVTELVVNIYCFS
jgi:hypothetical protein